jgi:hypothetical protein
MGAAIHQKLKMDVSKVNLVSFIPRSAPKNAIRVASIIWKIALKIKNFFTKTHPKIAKVIYLLLSFNLVSRL